MTDPEGLERAQKRWEHGSAIELADLPQAFEATPHWQGSLRFGTARQAFSALLGSLTSSSAAPRRIWFPDIYCHEVTELVRERSSDRGLEVTTYPAVAERVRTPDAAPGDVVVVSSTFGHFPEIERISERAIVIADVTHGHEGDVSGIGVPERWDYLIRSLRKLHPVADGALVQALHGGPLPEQPPESSEYERFVARLDDLLQMKTAYLEGAHVPKSCYWPLAKTLESSFGDWVDPVDMSSSSKARYSILSTAECTGAAYRNSRRFLEFLDAYVTGAQDSALPSIHIGCGGTFIPMTLSEPGRKGALFQALIEQSIWPSTLWPIPDSLQASWDSRRWVASTLVLNADIRYDANHMEELARRVSHAVDGLGLRVKIASA